MIIRRNTLSQALDEIQTGALKGASIVAVSRAWWATLSAHEQDAYRVRAEQADVELRADDVMTSHFVEVRTEDADPPPSTEHRT
jgi:hypothetical protein